VSLSFCDARQQQQQQSARQAGRQASFIQCFSSFRTRELCGRASGNGKVRPSNKTQVITQQQQKTTRSPKPTRSALSLTRVAFRRHQPQQALTIFPKKKTLTKRKTIINKRN